MTGERTQDERTGASRDALADAERASAGASVGPGAGSDSDAAGAVWGAASGAHLEWASLVAELHARLSSPAARATATVTAGEIPAAAGDEHASGEDPPDLPRPSWTTQDLAACVARHEEVDELERLVRATSDLDLGKRLSHVVDLAAPVGRARRGLALSVNELVAVCDALAVAVRIAEALGEAREDEPDRYGRLASLLAELAPPRTLAARLHRAIDRDGGAAGEPILADAASTTLASLRDRVRAAKASLRHAAERLLRRPGLADAFGDAFVTEREGRVVVPVRAGAFSNSGAPGTVGGIIHDASSSGQTLFVEPHALVDDNNALRTAIAAARAEEQRILAELSAEVGTHAVAIGTSVEALRRLDVVHARWQLGVALGGVAPILVEPTPGVRLELPGARHPLMLLRGRVVVPNDLWIDVGRALVVSGPNAGGKTVALKTIGLCVLLAQAGVRLPTSAPATVPVFRAVITDVGDDQSIARNLSTFTAHIRNVCAAWNAASRDPSGTLVLLDEVAVGTDPDEGAALAEAIVTELVESGATLVVTTHYVRLKLLAQVDPVRFENAAVGFDLERLRSTFRVHVGIPGNSSALAVARRVGLSPRIIDRAAKGLDPDALRVEALIADVAALREDLAEQREAMVAERAALAAARGRFERLERDETERASAKLLRAHEATAAELRSLQAELRAARKAARKGEVPAAELTARAGEAVSRHRPAAQPSDAPVPTTIHVGMRVRIDSLEAEGDVVEIKGERVTVQLAGLRTTVARDDLRAASAKPKRRPEPRAPEVGFASDAARHFGADARPVDPGIDNVVDLRGVRADEALALLEVSLARAIEDDREVLIVRHGHGSGALRQAVREHLPRLEHVARHRPGLAPEGGDAVTVVWVRG
jgi:DNA mismatch repair protein MutS2